MAKPSQDKTKILHFTSCWLPQTMTWLYTHIKFLPEDLENHVVCQWTENTAQFPIAHLRSLNTPSQPATLFSRLKRKLGMGDAEEGSRKLLEQTARQIHPSILHSHFGNRGWENSAIAQRAGIRHVVSFYGVDLSYLPKIDPRWKARYKEMSDRIDAVLCEGPHMARCIASLGVDPRKIHVFRLGIDLDLIPYIPRTNAKRPKRFLIQGSFREKKGIPYALEALGRLLPVEPDLEITVIGASGGSPREEEEKRRILIALRENNLESRTTFLGYIPYERVIEEFYRHDVFVSPSVTSSDGDTEGGAPVTILEAAASGMPVMSTTHCDIPFVLSKENQEYLVPERDSAALGDSIKRLLEREDWTSIVAANRRLAEEELDLRRQAEKLASIYRYVISPESNRKTASQPVAVR